MGEKLKCPICEHQLVLETFSQTGYIHKLGLNGKIQSRARSIDYGIDAALNAIYCPSCGHDVTSQVTYDGKRVKIKTKLR